MRHPQTTPEPPAAPARRPARPGEEVIPVGPLDPRPWWDEHTRLSDRWVAAPPVVAVREAPIAAAPGRHAARRPPEAPPRAGRLLLGPPQLAVVAVVVVVALATTCWWLARARPSDAPPLQAAPVAGLTAASASGATDARPAVARGPTSSADAESVDGSASAGTTVTVDVSGQVRHPGIQVLPPGARVADALRAAGGARSGVDLTSLNLAQVLVDGQQVLVGVARADGGPGGSVVTGGPPASSPGSTTGSPGSTTGSTTTVTVVDLNTASAEQLDTLPDVGPVTAQSILSWREAHGGFTSVDELLEVDGIGEVTLGKIAPYVRV